jgi:hypothetical protein
VGSRIRSARGCGMDGGPDIHAEHRGQGSAAMPASPSKSGPSPATEKHGQPARSAAAASSNGQYSRPTRSGVIQAGKLMLMSLILRV